jgi:SnoaL-like domain
MSNAFEQPIRAIYECWNADDLPGVLAAFSSMGPDGFTVEYVGEVPLEGVAAVQDMWNTYGGTCKTDVVHLLVNGSEAAALIHNRIRNADGTETVLPSIETYRIEEGRLAVRYFHQAPEGSYAKA